MQNFGSKIEKFQFHNQLTVLVKALEHKHTVIDLRNESTVSGLIKHVDGFMNIEMENVTFYDPKGRVHAFQDFYISARNIRYVHVPEGLQMMELIQKQMSLLQRSGIREKRKDNFKTIRAKRYNEEIKQSLMSRAGPSTQQ